MAGGVIDQLIPLSGDPASVDYMAWYFVAGLEEFVANDVSFVAFGVGLPSGLSVALECDDATNECVLRLTGTVTTAGAYTL